MNFKQLVLEEIQSPEEIIKHYPTFQVTGEGLMSVLTGGIVDKDTDEPTVPIYYLKDSYNGRWIWGRHNDGFIFTMKEPEWIKRLVNKVIKHRDIKPGSTNTRAIQAIRKEVSDYNEHIADVIIPKVIEDWKILKNVSPETKDSFKNLIDII
jgi:F420-0:gamma-glutamyl ligase-like protein